MPDESQPITVLLRSFEGGGAERVAVNLANGFADRGFPVDIVVQYRRGPYLSLVNEAIDVVELRKRVRYAIPELVSYLRKRRPVALLAATTEPNVLGILAWRLARLPGSVVATECSSLTILQRGRRLALRRVYPLATRIVAKSEQMRREIINEGLDPAKVVTIPNPVPPNMGDVPPHEAPPTERTPRIIAVGRLVPDKDYPTLIEAFRLLRQEQDAELLILGEGPDRPFLEDLVDGKGLAEHVTFGGFVSPPWEEMRQSSALVLSSLREGWPGVLVEAMALGVPVASTDCPTGPAEILDNGRYGPLVPVGSPSALAGAIRQALQHPVDAAQLRSRAMQWSADEIIPRYLSALGLAVPIAD